MTGSPTATLSNGRGSHFAYYDDDGTLVVEWYDFGAHAPYESANMLRFAIAEQHQLAQTLDTPQTRPETRPDQAALLSLLQARFKTYFEVKAYALAHEIPFTDSVDFMS